jgi:hypothetical protein
MNKEEQKQKREEWRIRIGEWEESGLTQIEFCRRNNLKAWQFHYWNKKFSKKKPVLPAFVQVPMSSVSRSCLIRIEIGNRYCVEVGDGYDPGALEHIIGLLNRA